MALMLRDYTLYVWQAGEETDANWSSGLTLWDGLHGTLRSNVPQDEITIGVPAYRASGSDPAGHASVAFETAAADVATPRRRAADSDACATAAGFPARMRLTVLV